MRFSSFYKIDALYEMVTDDVTTGKYVEKFKLML